MRKLLVYIAIIAAALVIPMNRTDVGRLIPVEAVFIYETEGGIVLETDTGDAGIGETVGEAVQNLKDLAPGIIFLDTADYLLATPGLNDKLEEIGAYLKESVRVCLAENGIDVSEAAVYLAAHQPKMSLKVAKTTEIKQKLQDIGGKIILS